MKSLIKFLEGESGEKSSKRLIFVLSAILFCIMSISALVYFLDKKQYDYAIELIKVFALFVLITGGYVTAEIFAKRIRKK